MLLSLAYSWFVGQGVAPPYLQDVRVGQDA